MDEQKKPFEEPSCSMLTLTLDDAATVSNWNTNKFSIPDINTSQQ